ncbi:hypothetical protein Lal_00040633 [Lupinus albus]|nr:hypothetical protein Lal_00040633 [Lupinus albus]
MFNKCPQLSARISQIQPTTDRDRFIWTDTNDGILTLKESYNCLSPISSTPSWWKITWSNSIPPSKSFTTWRLIHQRMPTDENLMSRGCSMASKSSVEGVNIIWFCRNQLRFRGIIINSKMAISKIKLAINMSGCEFGAEAQVVLVVEVLFALLSEHVAATIYSLEYYLDSSLCYKPSVFGLVCCLKLLFLASCKPFGTNE